MRVPHHSLKLFAAATWYVGGGILAFRGTTYLLGAIGSGPAWPPLVIGLVALGAGVVRGRTLFRDACERNLRRIDGLYDPRAWQFFRPGFFAALVLMIAAGAFLAWLAKLGYWGAVTVGGLELLLAVGLLSSSVVFWTGENGLRLRTGRVDPR